MTTDFHVCTDGRKLCDLFAEAWSDYDVIINSTAATNSDETQSLIDKTLLILGIISENVEQLKMFSPNEEIEEVATSDLCYFLVPAIRGDLNSRKNSDVTKRIELVEMSKTFFRTFLELCSSYNIGNPIRIRKCLKDEKEAGGKRRPDLEEMNSSREARIEKYRRSKQRSEELDALKRSLVDDDTKRRYWRLLIDTWVDKSIDEIGSINTEVEMLSFMTSQRENNVPKKVKKGKMPFILTKDKLQAEVFGAGYPSVPTVTLDEFFERERAAGRVPDSGAPPSVGAPPSEEEEVEEDVYKMRAMDDWKDDHRRGAGNRKNMG